jgi:hypothetical protein
VIVWFGAGGLLAGVRQGFLVRDLSYWPTLVIVFPSRQRLKVGRLDGGLLLPSRPARSARSPNPRGIAPSPSRVLATIPRAFWGRHSIRVARVFWPPHSLRVLVAIPRARGGAKASRQFGVRSFLALVGHGQVAKVWSKTVLALRWRGDICRWARGDLPNGLSGTASGGY